MADEAIMDLGGGPAFTERSTDPVITNVATPGDFAAQFPTPVDTTELVVMCEEVNVYRTIPEYPTSLKTYIHRELNELAFTSGSAYISFSDGDCPEEYRHDGDNLTVDLKNIGAKKSLTLSDILHSIGSIQAGYGMNGFAPSFSAGDGVPGGSPMGSGYLGAFKDLKAKEMQLAGVLVINGWDNLLVNGNKSTNPLAFDGIVTQVTAANGAHVDVTTGMSGTFSAQDFDRFLSESCGKATHLFGHPQALQEISAAYMQLGFAGSQTIVLPGQTAITPGYNFSSKIHTSVGDLTLVPDVNFPTTSVGGGKFQSTVYPLRMTHNGVPLVYKITQIPLVFKDLTPGCTAISFMYWAKTALVIRAMCAQSAYRRTFTGNLVTTCARI